MTQSTQNSKRVSESSVLESQKFRAEVESAGMAHFQKRLQKALEAADSLDSKVS